MKNILLIIYLLAVITGCSKSDTLAGNYDITGNWEMVKKFGMYPTKTFATGQGNVLQFSNGNKYKLSSNFQQVEEGVYKIVNKGAAQFNKTFDAIYFGGNSFKAISIRADSLHIYTAPNDEKGNQIMDGEGILYIRQR
jgi:hypothetical protein